MEKIEKCIYSVSVITISVCGDNHRYRNRVVSINRHRDQVLAKFHLSSAQLTI